MSAVVSWSVASGRSEGESGTAQVWPSAAESASGAGHVGSAHDTDPGSRDGTGGVRPRRADRAGSAACPVYLAPSWFIIAVVIVAIVATPYFPDRVGLGVALGVTQALLLLVSVLVHEAAHAADRPGLPACP